MLSVPRNISYTCRLFLSRRREIFILRVPGFFVENPIMSEDFQRRAEEFRSSQENENNLVSSAVLSKIGGHSHGRFLSYTGSSLFYFIYFSKMCHLRL